MKHFKEGALFSGANLGWSSLVYILKDLNFFNEKCQRTFNNGTHSTVENSDICLIGEYKDLWPINVRNTVLRLN